MFRAPMALFWFRKGVMDKKKKLENMLIEGYKAVRKEDAKVNKEWEYVTLEEPRKKKGANRK